jgi:hypothetical protein
MIYSKKKKLYHRVRQVQKKNKKFIYLWMPSAMGEKEKVPICLPVGGIHRNDR